MWRHHAGAGGKHIERQCSRRRESAPYEMATPTLVESESFPPFLASERKVVTVIAAYHVHAVWGKVERFHNPLITHVRIYYLRIVRACSAGRVRRDRMRRSQRAGFRQTGERGGRERERDLKGQSSQGFVDAAELGGIVSCDFERRICAGCLELPSTMRSPRRRHGAMGVASSSRHLQPCSYRISSTKIGRESHIHTP